MTHVLRWRNEEPPIVTRWRGQRRGGAVPARPAETGLAAIIGMPGRDASSGDFSHHHPQLEPAAEWIVNHNLGRQPAAIAVLSPGGMLVGADIIHVSPSQFRVYFTSPQAGSVRCSL